MAPKKAGNQVVFKNLMNFQTAGTDVLRYTVLTVYSGTVRLIKFCRYFPETPSACLTLSQTK